MSGLHDQARGTNILPPRNQRGWLMCSAQPGLLTASAPRFRGGSSSPSPQGWVLSHSHLRD